MINVPLKPSGNKVSSPIVPSTVVNVPLKPSVDNSTVTSERGVYVGDYGQYQDYLPNIYGIDTKHLDYQRAKAQGNWEQTGLMFANMIPNIALGLVENVGYMGSLLTEWGDDRDYTNFLTEFAQKHRNIAGETYRENPEKVFDLSDGAWWAENGGGLVESIGEFLITGMGIGSMLGKGAKVLTSLFKSAKLGKNTAKALGLGTEWEAKINKIITQGVGFAERRIPQAGTAFTLSYMEGAMDGAQVYKDVFAKTGNKHLAAESAATTVKLNTAIVGLLNLTGVNVMFKTPKNIFNKSRSGIDKAVKDAKTLGEKAAVAGAYEPELLTSKAYKLFGLEGIQESLEEVVNVYAQESGREAGGVGRYKSPMDAVFSEEGALSAILGFVGGVGQNAGMHNVKNSFYDDGSGKPKRERASKTERRILHTKVKEYSNDLKEDFNNLIDLNKKLSEAKTDEERAKIKSDIFNISSNREIKYGKAENLIEQLEAIANMPIEDAVKKGYADSENDIKYREEAVKKIALVQKLANDYDNIQNRFGFTEVEELSGLADKVFGLHLAITLNQDLLNDYKGKLSSLETEQRSINDKLHGIDIYDAISLSSKIKAIDKQIKDNQQILKNIYDPTNKVYSKYTKRQQDVAAKRIEKLSEQLHSEKHDLNESLKMSFEAFSASQDGKIPAKEASKLWSDALNNNTGHKIAINNLNEYVKSTEADLESYKSLYDDLVSARGVKEHIDNWSKAEKKINEDIDKNIREDIKNNVTAENKESFKTKYGKKYSDDIDNIAKSKSNNATKAKVDSKVDDYVKPSTSQDKNISPRTGNVIVNDTEGKRADIERRRQEKLDKVSQRIEKLNKREDRRIKVETYRTLDINDNPVEVEITTNADGTRVFKARHINEDGSVEPMAYVTERINNKAQASLTNEKLVEGYIGNEGNTLQRTNIDENPGQTYINKINAKYDAEVKALEESNQPTTSKAANIAKEITKDLLSSPTVVESEDDKIRRRTQMMIDLKNALKAEGKVNFEDFKAVAIWMNKTVGAEDFKVIFDKFQGLYNMINPTANKQNYNDIIPTTSEILSKTPKLNPKDIEDGEMQVFNKKNGETARKDSMPKDQDGNEIISDNGTIIYINDKAVEAGNKLAILSNAYTTVRRLDDAGNVIVQKITSSSIKNPNLFKAIESHTLVQAGDKIKLVFDPKVTFEGYSNGNYVATAGFESKGIIDIDNIPIAVNAIVKDKEVTIGWLHNLAWITAKDDDGGYKNIVDVVYDADENPIDNAEIQIQLIKDIRNAVYEAYKDGKTIETTIENKVSYRVNKNIKEDKDGFIPDSKGRPQVIEGLMSDLIPGNVDLAIIKEGKPYISRTKVFNKTIVNDASISDGTLWMVLPSAVKDKYILEPVFVHNLVEKQIDNILGLIKVFYNKNTELADKINANLTKEKINKSLDLTDASSLKGLLGDYMYVVNGSIKNKINKTDKKVGIPFIGITSKGELEFGRNMSNKITSIKDAKSLKDNLTALEEVLKEMYFTTRIDKINNKNKVMLINFDKEGQITTMPTYQNYNTYLKDYLYTEVNGKNTIPETGEYVYTTSPTILMNTSFLKPKTIINNEPKIPIEPKESKPKNEKSMLSRRPLIEGYSSPSVETNNSNSNIEINNKIKDIEDQIKTDHKKC